VRSQRPTSACAVARRPAGTVARYKWGTRKLRRRRRARAPHAHSREAQARSRSRSFAWLARAPSAWRRSLSVGPGRHELHHQDSCAP
jgi:hypothetical protein